ncbi:MAG: hypothetical protein EA355_11240 [Rhodobacteraceae bacterium]|nr:MAG: hypothetical protein EA355_11240 [Paracoccaceae bacterium]
MTRLTLAFAIAALLLCFAGLGMLASWLWRRARGEDHAAERLARMAAQLHAAEVARDAAMARLSEGAAAAEASAHETETRLSAALREACAERDAAMEALRDARRDAAEWRAAYEGLSGVDRVGP